VPPDTVLQHNMLARVALPIGRTSPALAVPVTAIVRNGTQAYVFIRDPDGSFRRQAVELGRSDDRFVAVADGLRPGEIVAVAGVADLQTAFASIR
jgi:multidrug efflux pump subunit AcrA (membrane-fusion protein)